MYAPMQSENSHVADKQEDKIGATPRSLPVLSLSPAMADATHRKVFATIGMFIIDDFDFLDEDGKPTGQTRDPQVHGARHRVLP